MRNQGFLRADGLRVTAPTGGATSAKGVVTNTVPQQAVPVPAFANIPLSNIPVTMVSAPVKPPVSGPPVDKIRKPDEPAAANTGSPNNSSVPGDNNKVAPGVKKNIWLWVGIGTAVVGAIGAYLYFK